MLGNNEQIQGVNLSEVFSQMLGELPWSNLLVYIQTNSTLQKMCTIGGHRLVPEKRKRFEQIICRDAEKQGYAEAVTNGVFASWYPVHAELHKLLEDYFHSDEYKQYRVDNKVSDDEYVLSDAKLDEFFNVNDLRLWKILLCFSPLKFTHEQMQKLLHDNSGNEELVTRIKGLESSNADLLRKNEQLNAEAVKLRTRQNDDASEIQELKKQLRQQKQEMELVQKKLESAQVEARRASQQMQQTGNERADAENAIRVEAQRTQARIQSELDRVNKELVAWQARYEEQRSTNKQLEADNAAAHKQQNEQAAQLAVAEKKISEGGNFADLILERIDWPHVGSALKLTPMLRRNFNSLIKKLNYEEDRTMTIEGTLKSFWESLATPESALVEAIVKSNVEEVANGSISSYWESLKGQFSSVETSLEARLVLLSMLEDIFYQTIEMEDLNDAFLGKTKPKKKADEAK